MVDDDDTAVVELAVSTADTSPTDCECVRLRVTLVGEERFVAGRFCFTPKGEKNKLDGFMWEMATEVETGDDPISISPLEEDTVFTAAGVWCVSRGVLLSSSMTMTEVVARGGARDEDDDDEGAHRSRNDRCRL